MRVLLIAGLSRPYKQVEYLEGTLFHPGKGSARRRVKQFISLLSRKADLRRLCFTEGGERRFLLRPVSEVVPHLTTETLASLLRIAGIDYVVVPLEALWSAGWADAIGHVDVVCLSTTFICNRRSMEFVVSSIIAAFGDVPLVVGGQYSNLKWATLLRDYQAIDYIVLGDAEPSLVPLLQKLENGLPVNGVPNLVRRDGFASAQVVVDLDQQAAPVFAGHFNSVPYESLRGCPYHCRFCSYPSASPQWRYRSAARIVSDWRGYAERNGVHHIKAMDSTFTVPRKRLDELLDALPNVGVSWEAYARANHIRTVEDAERLCRAGCRELSIGFESMSDTTLTAMNKGTDAASNRHAAEMLRAGGVGLRICLMAGYPGETPEEFRKTRDFLVHESSVRSMLSPFSFIDETMPVWNDRKRYGIEVDVAEPDSSWVHCGMSLATARSLIYESMDALRWQNEIGVTLLWQMDYEAPLVPPLSAAANQRIEKLVERLAYLPRDFDADEACRRFAAVADELARFGIFWDESDDVRFLDVPHGVWIDFI